MTEFAIAILVFIAALIFMGVKMVPQGYNYTVERFGRYVTTMQPGLGLLIPMIYRVGRKVNMMEQVLDILPNKSLPPTMPTSTLTAWCSTKCLTPRKRRMKCLTCNTRF
nr:SPFH domain-containing protein [Thiothrix subterranea]